MLLAETQKNLLREERSRFLDNADEIKNLVLHAAHLFFFLKICVSRGKKKACYHKGQR